MAEINMNDVDVYPLFQGCDETSTKTAQKNCFEAHLATYFSEIFNTSEVTVTEDITDTIYVYFIIDNTGNIQFQKAAKSTQINTMFPQLDSLLKAKTATLPTVYPAQKTGIKVASKCKLPIIINTVKE
ncbi:hypothetical protein [Neptunitalea lumnitzerae]|uniref:Uncharacterized protein n=1 Tax=Neptunitalea lumnitzerae TaxID=2965509 RepID=A0ABQ5MHG1_9FLAO|nr:hypothetical protein [Neptunitalea sp. Y10]GLB48470.1 hypothetical protein Y10_08380 [Neptunitalea sp. Y10]